MYSEQLHWTAATDWQITRKATTTDFQPQLVLVFGRRHVLDTQDFSTALKAHYPQADIIGCSTSGEILGQEIHDDSVVATALQFTHTKIQVSSVEIPEVEGSYTGGETLAKALQGADLRAVLTFADGVNLNGTQYVRGITDTLGHNIPVSGGMAGDDVNERDACVIANSLPMRRYATAIGFYGDALQINHGCFGGWTPYGPEWIITRSAGAVLYEIDHKPALDVYKRYLGPEADELPGSAQLFPLTIRPPDAPAEVGLVRTVLDVDEAENSLIFTGDMPTGHYAQFMHANFERIIQGANDAAQLATKGDDIPNDSLALLVSCLGRRMVLGQRTVEEIEAAAELFAADTHILGFYSYGEISPYVKIDGCQLHNQTMTITVFGEKT